MNPCPKCKRLPVSSASPRCNYCGAALQHGELDWEALKSKNLSDQTKLLDIKTFDYLAQNGASGRQVTMSKELRAMALPSLTSEANEYVACILAQIVEGLKNDYSIERANGGRQCGCGCIANRVVQVDWAFKYSISRELEFNAAHAVFLVFGLLAWSRNESLIKAKFSTYHESCSSCAEPLFSSKIAFEKAVEPLPGIFQYVGAKIYDHASIKTDRVTTSENEVTPTADSEPTLYFLIFDQKEKGPFSLPQLSQLFDTGRVPSESKVRIEGGAALVTVGEILGDQKF